MIKSNYFNQELLTKHPALSNFYMRVGSTPLLEIESPPGHAKIFAKCEWFNPAETIKARVALAMVWDLLDKIEVIPKNTTILEYSGGGLSLALAELCRDLSINCKIVLMETSPKSLIAKLITLGAELFYTQKDLGFWGVMERAIDLSRENPDWNFLYQHTNHANMNFHKEITAGEIIDQVNFVPDAWIASIGTGGTLCGIYEGLKDTFPEIKIYATNPKELPYGSEQPVNSLPKFAGSGGLGEGRKQEFMKSIEIIIEKHFLFSYKETKDEMFRFYLQTGLMIGSSAAANLLAARELAADLDESKNILTIFPSKAFEEEQTEILELSKP